MKFRIPSLLSGIAVAALFCSTGDPTCNAASHSSSSLNVRSFILKHPRAIVTSWGVECEDGTGFEEEVFDDVDAGVAIEFGDQDADYPCNHIIDGTFMGDEIVHHRKGVMYRFTDVGNKITRAKPDPLLRISFLRKEIHLELTGKIHGTNFE